MAFPLSTPRTACHVSVHAAAIALATLTHVLCELVRNLANHPNVANAFFQVSSRNVSAAFPLEVSMDSWADNCWIMINIWTFAWLLHAITDLFQRSAAGRLSCNPEIHSPLFYLIWIAINMFRMASIIHWSRYDLVGTLLSRWLVVGCSFTTLGMSYYNLGRHSSWLQTNHPAQICWIRYLCATNEDKPEDFHIYNEIEHLLLLIVQNGLAVFCCWSLLEALVVLGQVLCYLGGIQDSVVSSLILTLILLFLVTWFVLGSIMFPKLLRYTFSVHPTLILGLGAMFTASYSVQAVAVNTIYCGVLMVLATGLSVSRTVSSCFLSDDHMDPPVEFSPTSEGCKTVCQPEKNSKHIHSVQHILKKILHDV